MTGRIGYVLAGVLFLAGCGQEGARFVYNEQTSALMPEASEAVKQTLDEHFGNPQQLVAWTKLPVDYGQWHGQVAQSDGNSAYQFKIVLDSGENHSLPAGRNWKGTGLLWETGPFADRQYELDGRDYYFEWMVENYDPQTQILTVSVSPPSDDLAAMLPEVGSKFTVAGAQLQAGRKLYMEHCMHCHGVSGDGNGPTAKYLNPLPRDYRHGVFKFTSTLPTERIRRDDFARIIRHGIPGTYMPSFMLLEDDELDAIIEYVRWLSMRGELERQMGNEMAAPGYTLAAFEQRVKDGEDKSAIRQELATFIQDDFPGAVANAADVLVTNWENAEQESSVVIPKVPRTPADAASLARGRELFLSDRAKCATCHGPTGRGDGSETETLKPLPGSTTEFYPEPGLFDNWGHKIQPRDLTQGIYRGGRRPVDLYRRIYSGIKGTPMPAFGGTVLKDEEIWDLVNYVLSIPYYGADSPEKVKAMEVAGRTEQNSGLAKTGSE